MWRTGAHQPGRELIEIGFTDHDGTGSAQIGDHGGIRRRQISELRAGRAGRPAADVDVVFYRKGYAKQRELADIAGERFKLLRQSLVLHFTLCGAGKIQPGVVIRRQVGGQCSQGSAHAGNALVGWAGVIVVLPFAEGETA
ncbi:hypothetical protein D3C72_1591230 [compost metagenome]